MANDRDIKRGRQEDIDTEPRAVKRLCSELAVAYNSSSALDVGKNQSSLMEVKSKGTEDSGPIPPGCVVSKDDDQPDICFGTICEVAIRFSNNQIVLLKSGIISGRPDASKLNIKQNDSHYAIHYGDVDVGSLNTKFTEALRILERFDSVRQELEVDPLVFARCIATWKNNGKVPDLHLEVNLFGPSAIKDTIGSLLSKSKIYLQRPLSIAKDIVVDNPQLLRFPNLPSSSEAQIELSTNFVTIGTSGTPSAKISTVLEDLDQNQVSSDAAVEVCVLRPLLEHQLRALNFMAHRESYKPAMAQLSLWNSLESVGADTRRFRHKITKNDSRVAEECCGGIIADEMGLGKSLTMLSNIVSTKERAYGYSKSNEATKSGILLSKGTLIVVPSAMLLDNWYAEIEKHLAPNSLSVHRYHLASKEKSLRKLLEYDVVMTTYATITAEFSDPDNCRLHQISWYRIVLDEAHMIRNQSTKIFRAITSLLGKIRWCLTGTPIQNKLEDLAALVRFLQVPSLLNPREFKRYCIEPVERKGADGFANIRALLQIICIRRTQGLLKLPEHETIEHKLELSDTERLQYSKVTEDYKAAIEEAICGRKTADAYTSILKALLDLRRICNYGTSILTPTLPDGEEPQISSPEALTYCVYCGMKISTQGLEEDLPAVRLPACTHLSCFSCLEMYLADMEKSANCPTCLKLLQNRTPTPQQQIVKSPIPSGRDKYVSTKFKKLLEDVQAHMKSDKCIIFSEWKQTLQNFALVLTRYNIPFVQLDGSLSLSARQEVLKSFQHNPETTILLMTLGTGAVGLNLTIATRIHLIEPQWNPTIESQAIGRALRFGQNRRVTIIRYVMQDTVEQYIQTRQARKLDLANLGFGKLEGKSSDDKLAKLKDLRDVLGV